VRYRKLGGAPGWIHWYGGQDFAKDAESRRKWNVALALVSCAQLAIRASRSIDRIPQSEEVFHQLFSDDDWVQGCIRSLKEVATWGRTTHIPVVGVSKEADAAIHTLAVEILGDGKACVFRHPWDAFDTTSWLDTGFRDSMKRAFLAANGGGSKPVVDGRWRLLQGWEWDSTKRAALEPSSAPSGTSASAAAAIAWGCALDGTLPDTRVVVIAEITSTGEVGPVDDAVIPAKIAAVSAAPRHGWHQFDTVAVTTENFVTARKAAEKFGGTLRIVNITNHEDATANGNLTGRDWAGFSTPPSTRVTGLP